MKNIAILGSTGSIGTQSLEVISENQDKFKVELLTANKNSRLLIEQIKEFNPKNIIITDKKNYKIIKKKI